MKTSIPSDINPQASTSQVCDEHLSQEIMSRTSEEKRSHEIKYDYNELLTKYNELEKQHKLLKNSSGKKIKLLNDQLRHYKSKCQQLCQNKKEETDAVKKMFTKNQMNMLLNRRKRVNWTSEEAASAFTLRYYSKKAYLYVKEKLHFPLPGLSSLRRWASKLKISNGILTSVLEFMQLAGESMNDFEKTVVLCFDEVKVQNIVEYDVGNDRILGPHNYMQCIMARGLFSNWKQPIFLDFDRRMTSNILFSIIDKLSEKGFKVVAIVSDCGSTNVGLWKDLGIDINNTSFKHPATNRDIFVFADIPHLLKLIRNWLLDTGFQLKDGSLINKNPLEELLKVTDTELNVCYKISKKHLECNGPQRQNVRLAAELLSETTAKALARYKPGNDPLLAVNVATFISDINQWFDIFNSYAPRNKLASKNAFGINLESQVAHLDKIIDLIENMKPIGKTSIQTFQKGIIISTKSLKGLFNSMKEEFNAAYICTHRLNQDCLENFFFQLRSRGGADDHPSPLNALYRIRMIILGKNPGILSSHVNTEEAEPQEYLSAKVFEQAEIALNPSDNNLVEINLSISSSSSTSSNDSSNLETANDALEYIAGYIAKKFKDKYPDLGDYTHQLLLTEHQYNLPSWVEHLSYGGLIKPKRSWLQKVKKMNKYFLKYHGPQLEKKHSVTKQLSNFIYQKENIPLDLVQNFIKLRTIIKINYENIKQEEKKIKNRKRKIVASERKTAKKFKKIVS